MGLPRVRRKGIWNKRGPWMSRLQGFCLDMIALEKGQQSIEEEARGATIYPLLGT